MKVEIGSIYNHFKGHKYKVLMIVKNASTLEEMVVYENIEDKTLVWVRPLSEFISKVDKVKYPSVLQEYRFEKVND